MHTAFEELLLTLIPSNELQNIHFEPAGLNAAATDSDTYVT
jgi:hypothetical protein